MRGLRKKMRSIKLENIKKTFMVKQSLRISISPFLAVKFLLFLGPSGSGKTTILRLIAGFEKVDEGTIYLG